ncbi:MAG TPA: adenylate/guanylate cyclase domain-containing protein [Candidatus Dormibacteraeota bacterium]|jgi:class 3 adenylate cyclase|nr:adenylate/guanylate cyclase domain-containing protein [Candidatus Dormibacteraeota bacterium]
MPDGRITVFLADDNLIVREGVRALLQIADDIEVVGVAGDYEGLVGGAERLAPQVVVSDIRMPPTFHDEGIRGAREIRRIHPGTGVVILSQFDEPEYAISLLAEGASGLAYLLKDRVGEGDQLLRAIREVSAGGSMLDPRIVEAMTRPVTEAGDLTAPEAALLQAIAEGRPVKAIAAAHRTTAAAVDEEVNRLFLKLAQEASGGVRGALERLKMLHQAIVMSEEQGETLSRLLPGGVAAQVRRVGTRIGQTEKLVLTVVMSDVRGYSTIAEAADPSVLALQLNRHRGEMNRAILSEGGTIMQFVGDAVMAVFGAPVPQPDHPVRAVAAALKMHRAQAALNGEWAGEALPAFGLGIGVSTGEVAAALLGSEERLEYSVVGDSVNLAQRIQQWAEAGQTVLSEATYRALPAPPDVEALAPQTVKGRHTPVSAYRIEAAVPG